MGYAEACDDRAKEILDALSFGKSRDELSGELGYKNYKSIDMYMRRRNYKWDSKLRNYVPCFSNETVQDKRDNYASTDKVQRIIKLFEDKDADPIEIARKVSFHNHREMADYMKVEGYIWDSDVGNYIKKNEKVEAKCKSIDSAGCTNRNIMDDTSVLEILEKNKDKLLVLLEGVKAHEKIPRYILPGVFITKSVHMTSILDSIVKEFSREKNISQREIFEVALIDFFCKYGYEDKISSILN